MSIIIDKTYKGQWIKNEAEVYHGDKTAVNSSSLKTMIKSPLAFKNHFWSPPKEETQAMKFGTLLHKALLEGQTFLDQYVPWADFGDIRKTENKVAKQKFELENAGKIFVTQKELDDIRYMIDAVINHADAFALLKSGVTEVSGYFACEKSGIKQRIRPDFLAESLNVLVDVKTCRDLSREEFSKSIWNYRYDFQMAMYSEGIRRINGKRPDSHAWIAIEKGDNIDVAVYIADEGLLSKGESDYNFCMDRLEKALKTNSWEKYQPTMQQIGLPYWALKEL